MFGNKQLMVQANYNTKTKSVKVTAGPKCKAFSKGCVAFPLLLLSARIFPFIVFFSSFRSLHLFFLFLFIFWLSL